MATATSNRVRLRYIKEATFGTTPSNGASTDMRFTGESLQYNINTDTSKEIRADRNVVDLVHLDGSVTGDVNFELSYGTFDEFLAAAVGGVWVNNELKNGTQVPFFSIEKGFTDINQYLLFKGMAVNTMNLNFSVGAILTGSFGFIGRDAELNGTSGVPAVGAVAQPAVLIQPLGNANLELGGDITLVVVGTHSGDSGVIEFDNKDDLLFQLVNLEGVASAAISSGNELVLISTQTGATAGLDITALTMWETTGVAANTAAVDDVVNGSAGTPMPLTEIMNASSNFSNLSIAGTAYPCGISQVSLATDAGLRAQNSAGNLGACDIVPGTFSPTGQFIVYFSDGTIYDKYIANSSFSLSWKVEDAAGNSYTFTFPKVKITSSNVVAGGLDQDVTLDVNYQALYDSGQSCSIKIKRDPA